MLFIIVFGIAGRLQTESRYLELSRGPVIFSLCSLPEADSLEKLEIKIIQPFLETWLSKIGNVFFSPFLVNPTISWEFSFFKKNLRKPLTVIYLPFHLSSARRDGLKVRVKVSYSHYQVSFHSMQCQSLCNGVLGSGPAVLNEDAENEQLAM